MTRTYSAPSQFNPNVMTRRITKVGLGEAEFAYAGCELVNVRFGQIGSTLHIRHEGNVITLSGSESEIRAMMRAFGF